jgi:nicotinamide-nucleotide amidase
MNPACTIITIGDELLIGQTIDTNSAWIATKLNALGIEVLRRVAVGDAADAITTALDEELPRNQLLILTGGLGPTADDITKPLLAAYFGGTLVVNDEVLAHVTEMFRRRNRPMLERNLKQAEVPDSCEVLFNSQGTAPGMWFEKDGCIVISLPGVPFEMAGIMERVALPKIAARLQSQAIVHRNILTAGEGESFVAERIQDLEAALPAHIRLAYLPSIGSLKLRLTARGDNEAGLISATEVYQRKIAERLENIVVALEDMPLQQVLGASLQKRGLTLGLAESCTGGYIAHLITQIGGASEYLSGGIVCYHNMVKTGLLGVQQRTIDEQHVVSEAVAREMAAGAQRLLGSDIGFGITGLLSGDYNGVKSGTVCMAIHSAERQYSRTFQFHLDRIRNKEWAANSALLLLWQFVEGRI